MQICYSSGADRIELARKHYATAVKLNPTNLRALYGLYLVQLENDDYNIIVIGIAGYRHVSGLGVRENKWIQSQRITNTLSGLKCKLRDVISL